MQKFNFGKTFLLGFGFFGVSVIWSVYNAFVPVFLQDRFLMAPAFIGFFMTLDNIAALFIQPAVGAWSDRIRTTIGRRLPFILIGAPIAALAFFFLPFAKALPLFFMAALVLLLSMAIWRTPIVALMPDVTPSKYRSQANGIINFMGGIGTVIALLIGAKLYNMDTANHAYPFWMGSFLVVIAAVLVIIFVREPKIFEKSDEERPSLCEISEVHFPGKRQEHPAHPGRYLLLVCRLLRDRSLLHPVRQQSPAHGSGDRCQAAQSARLSLPDICLACRLHWRCPGTQAHHPDRHRHDDHCHRCHVLHSCRCPLDRVIQPSHPRHRTRGRHDHDVHRDRLGADQHQFPAHGGGYDR